jgi:hypothetical protein
MTASECHDNAMLQKTLATGPSIHVPSIQGDRSVACPWTLGSGAEGDEKSG